MDSNTPLFFCIIVICINAVVMTGSTVYQHPVVELAIVNGCLNNTDTSQICGNILASDSNSTITTSSTSNFNIPFFSDLVKWGNAVFQLVVNMLFIWTAVIDSLQLGVIGTMFKFIFGAVQVIMMFLVFKGFIKG